MNDEVFADCGVTAEGDGFNEDEADDGNVD